MNATPSAPGDRSFLRAMKPAQFGSPGDYVRSTCCWAFCGKTRRWPELGGGTLEAIRKEGSSLRLSDRESPTSVDLPLSRESKRALAFAAEEYERLNHEQIDSSHLVLGLLREEDEPGGGVFAEVWNDVGGSAGRLRARRSPVSTPPRTIGGFRAGEPAPVAPSRGARIAQFTICGNWWIIRQARLRGYAHPMATSVYKQADPGRARKRWVI